MTKNDKSLTIVKTDRACYTQSNRSSNRSFCCRATGMLAPLVNFRYCTHQAIFERSADSFYWVKKVNLLKTEAMIAYENIYDSLADFIADMEAEKVLAFHAPTALQERVEQLLNKKETEGLSERETEELTHYYILEHIVRLAKSRTRSRLAKTRRG